MAENRVERTVWIDCWEHECCGRPFRVGSRVEWCLQPASNRLNRYLAKLFGPGVLGYVSHAQTNHGPYGRRALVVTSGTVESISAVFGRNAPLPDQPRAGRLAVPGSGRIRRRAASIGWEHKITGGREFAGYIVDLSSVEVVPERVVRERVLQEGRLRKTFEAMMSEQIEPAMHKIGFDGSERVYVLRSDTHWAWITFREVRPSDRERIRFQIHVCVIGKEEWQTMRERFPFNAPEQPTWWHGWGAPVRHWVVSEPDRPHTRRWFVLNPDEPAEALVDHILTALKLEALPLMRTVMS